MHRAVAKVVMVQFIAQGIGFILAGLLDIIGLAPLLILQILMFLLSSVLIKRSHPQLVISSEEEPAKKQDKAEPLEDLRAGFALSNQ